MERKIYGYSDATVGYNYQDEVYEGLVHAIGEFLEARIADHAVGVRDLLLGFNEVQDRYRLNRLQFRQLAKLAGFIAERRTVTARHGPRTEWFIRRRKLKRVAGGEATYGERCTENVEPRKVGRVKTRKGTSVPPATLKRMEHLAQQMLPDDNRWWPRTQLYQTLRESTGFSTKKITRALRTLGFEFRPGREHKAFAQLIRRRPAE